MTTVQIGLATAKESYRVDASDEVLFRPVTGLRVLYVHPPDTASTTDVFNDITRPNGVLAYHSDEAPGWVDSDNATLAQLLAEHWTCSVGAPADVETTHWTMNGPPLDGTGV